MIMRISEEVLHHILSHLEISNALSTLDSVSRCSRFFNSVSIPILYRTHKLRDDLDYDRLLGTRDTPHGDVMKDPLDYVKHLQIAHFPSVTLCSRIAQLAQTKPLLPNVQSITFTLASCYSIRWGPMHRHRHPSSLITPSEPISGKDMILSFARIATPSILCVRLNHYSVFDRDWNTFFQTVCEPWKERLERVSIHGMEYWLKAFVPGIPHDVFLDIDNVSYRPGTGLMVAQGSAENRGQCVETWAEVLSSMVQDGLERDAQEVESMDNRTTWTLHCPGARLVEIIESEEVLEQKLRAKCGPLYERTMGFDVPLLRFVTAETISCGVCNESAPRTAPRRRPIVELL